MEGVEGTNMGGEGVGEEGRSMGKERSWEWVGGRSMGGERRWSGEGYNRKEQEVAAKGRKTSRAIPG
jgi:hypothetical protein